MQSFRQSISRPQAKAPRAKMEFFVNDFMGIKNSEDPESIGNEYSPDSLNQVLDTVGSVQPRQGYTKLLTTKTPAASSNGTPFYKSDGTKQLIYGTPGFLYRYDNAGGSTQIGGTYANSGNWDFDVYNDTLYAVDGSNFISYNGSTTTTVSTTAGTGTAAQSFTAPQYLRVHKNRTWIAQNSTIYFSDAGQPTAFPTVNFININTNDGQFITGIEVNLDSLVIFKTDSIWVITGEPQGSGTNTTIGNLILRRANSAVGCVSYKTIKKVESVLYFMARDGLYIFSNYQSKIVSTNVNNTFSLDMNTNAQGLSWALYVPTKKKFILGYTSPGSSVPDKALVWDLIVREFTVWDHFPGNWGTGFRFSNTDTYLMGDPSVGNIYQLFQGYADIAGYNGVVGSGTSTTLVDPTAAWTTNQFIDARVQVGLGSGTITTGVVTANTATTLTVGGWTNGTPSTLTPYTIGGYTSYWKSKIFDFDAPEMTKRYKYLNFFMDSETNYNLQIGLSVDFAPLNFNLPALPLSANSATWDGAYTWDSTTTYDQKASLFKRANMPGTGRFAQIIFGNYNANQPYRVFEYSILYKLKRARSN